MQLHELTRAHVDELYGVCHGADITGYVNAIRCRELARLDLVMITELMNPVDDVMAPQPYFGCIATAAGREFLKNYIDDWRVIEEGFDVDD